MRQGLFCAQPVWQLRGVVVPRDEVAARGGCGIRVV